MRHPEESMTFRALMLLAVLLAPPVFAAGAPCTTATPECTEWVKLGGGPARSLIYRTHSLETRNERITRAMIMVHGSGRDAHNYFRSAVAAAFLAGALDDAVVVAPRFASNDRGCRDTLAPEEVSWSCAGDSWRSGGTAAGNERLTSYDLADEILKKLARKEVFPNLNVIVVAGHSAGGQFVTRYEMANTVHETLGVPVRYVVSNPSSYAYLDANRPAATSSGTTTEFRPFGDARNCTTYDRWPYGLQNRTGYTAKLTDEQLKKQIAARPVVYLLGGLDTLPLGGFDSSCPAMAQGPSRLARGQAFAQYVNTKFAAQHKTLVVPLCGHNGRCMFTADPALELLFPKP
jgi:pimeloyl-ACP methyl ester carboxylesterase